MGTKINVDAVKATAQHVNNETQGIQEAIKKLQSGVENLGSIWRGNAASKYAAASADIHSNLATIANSAKEISDKLTATAAQYDAADQV